MSRVFGMILSLAVAGGGLQDGAALVCHGEQLLLARLVVYRRARVRVHRHTERRIRRLARSARGLADLEFLTRDGVERRGQTLGLFVGRAFYGARVDLRAVLSKRADRGPGSTG